MNGMEMDLSGKRVFVVDAYGLVYQVFHALPPMFGKDGEMVNAVFGFVRDIFLLLEHQCPDLLFCAFDLHAPTFRSQLYSEYKATREKMPEELIGQIPRIREILETLRIPVLALEGFEADDILATAAERVSKAGGTCILVTSDKDSRQLISDSVSIFSLRRNLYLDREFLIQDWGIAPEQVVDYQALVGDSSDNVPGIALIGPKVAKDLLLRFGNLDEILKPENLDVFFGPKMTKRKENLLNGVETALLCRDLVRLERNVPIEIDWESGKVENFDFRSVLPIFEQYAFKSMILKAGTFAKNAEFRSQPGIFDGFDPEEGGENGVSAAGSANRKQETGKTAFGIRNPSGTSGKLLEKTSEVFAESIRNRVELPFFEGRFEMPQHESGSAQTDGTATEHTDGPEAVRETETAAEELETLILPPALWSTENLKELTHRIFSPGALEESASAQAGVSNSLPDAKFPKDANAGMEEAQTGQTDLFGLFDAADAQKLNETQKPQTCRKSEEAAGSLNENESQTDLFGLFDAAENEKNGENSETSESESKGTSKCASKNPLLCFLLENREKLASASVVKVGFDLKNLRNSLRHLGLELHGPQFDVMLAAYIFQPDGKHDSLKALSEAFPEAVKDPEVQAAQTAIQKELETQKESAEDEKAVPHESLSEPGSRKMPEPQKKKSTRTKKGKVPEDPHFTEFESFQRPFLRSLFQNLTQKLIDARLDRVCFGLEFPLAEVLAEMEFWGIFIQKERLEEISKRFGKRIGELSEDLYALVESAVREKTSEKTGEKTGMETGEENEAVSNPETGEENKPGNKTKGDPAFTLENVRSLNLNSPRQLQKILFETLELPILHKTKTGPSTDAQTLEELADLHPFPARLLEYRQMVKLQNTYVEALPRLISPADGRIHTSFNQAVTATGRLSSSEPNLQNIPVRTEEGKLIRSAFVPEYDGWSFVSADYSQIELRVLAHYCGDENLCEAFRKDQDIHARVASQIHSVPLDEVTPAMRRAAKTVNFGVIYGQSSFGLAAQLKIPQDEARTFIQTYFMQFPAIESFLDTVLEFARENGYVSTLFGRRRPISGIRPVQKGQLNLAERMAVNTVIQGSAADLIKLAMLRVYARLKRAELRSRLLLQIHDELLLETPPEEIEAVQEILREEMTNAWTLSVPLKVDVEVGREW